MNPIQKNKHTKLSPYAYRKLKLFVYERDGGVCRKCGTTQNLTLAHLKHKKMGGGSGVGDVPENCEILCMRCHDLQERNQGGEVKK